MPKNKLCSYTIFAWARDYISARSPMTLFITCSNGHQLVAFAMHQLQYAV